MTEEVTGDAPLIDVDVDAAKEDGAPTLTLSALFRSVGVPARESGLSIYEVVVRTGSELFWVISSRNASTSAASPGFAGLGAAVDALPLAGTSGERESRSSRNCKASSCLDLDLVDMIEGTSISDGVLG